MAAPRRRVEGRHADHLLASLRVARVGGCFWGARPMLEKGRDLVLAPCSDAAAGSMQARARAEGRQDRVVLLAPARARTLDPWHLADQAAEIWADADHEIALVAALCNKPLTLFGEGRYAALRDYEPGGGGLGPVIAELLIGGTRYVDPFSGAEIDVFAAVELLAGWRRLIDANRKVAAIYGVAGWKRATASALLWSGGDAPPYRRARTGGLSSLRPGDSALIWKSRAPSHLPAELERRGVSVGEVEDGFIRSSGLGANCVPPLSIVVDHQGIYFDPRRPSDLENIIQNGAIGPDLARRAAALRQRLVQEGVSKYGRAAERFARPAGARRTVLVTGQVEDDRSILTGGAGCTNLELVRQARRHEPDAFLIYKPHPDVEAGHRKGRVPDGEILAHADLIERQASITALLDSVDAVHVITSLAGFEALMRDKAVTTHGVPFFAGWGLTTDLAAVPARRTARPTIDELVAAVLILYPRYLDPVTRLPCPVEVLVDRMASGAADVRTPLVRLRQVQGRLHGLWSAIRGRN